MSAYVLTLAIDSRVGGVWYWHLRCWDDQVNEQETIMAGAVKVSVDPQIALMHCLDECRDQVAKQINERWALPLDQGDELLADTEWTDRR